MVGGCLPTITALSTADVRFPTSRDLDGSDAMNPDPDYSAAYVTLDTDGEHHGASLVFTIGRGNDVVVAGIDALRDARRRPLPRHARRRQRALARPHR